MAAVGALAIVALLFLIRGDDSTEPDGGLSIGGGTTVPMVSVPDATAPPLTTPPDMDTARAEAATAGLLALGEALARPDEPWSSETFVEDASQVVYVDEVRSSFVETGTALVNSSPTVTVREVVGNGPDVAVVVVDLDHQGTRLMSPQGEIEWAPAETKRLQVEVVLVDDTWRVVSVE